VRRPVDRIADRVAVVLGPRLPTSKALGRALRRLRRRLVRRRPTRQLYRIIFEFARAYPRAFFIQIGANDGQGEDPLREEIITRRWSGILVEPVPHVFERLRRYYGDIPRLRLENAAIADHDGVHEMYALAPAQPGDKLPYWYEGLASLRKEILLKHRAAIPDIDRRLMTLQVPSLTFTSLCRKHGVSSVDLVQIDTEGYDFEVVKLINLDELRPKIIMFENYHMDPDTHDACLEYLRGYGYEHLSDGMDTVAVHVESLTRRGRRLRRVWRRMRKSYVPDSWGPATKRDWRSPYGHTPSESSA